MTHRDPLLLLPLLLYLNSLFLLPYWLPFQQYLSTQLFSFISTNPPLLSIPNITPVIPLPPALQTTIVDFFRPVNKSLDDTAGIKADRLPGSLVLNLLPFFSLLLNMALMLFKSYFIYIVL